MKTVLSQRMAFHCPTSSCGKFGMYVLAIQGMGTVQEFCDSHICWMS